MLCSLQKTAYHNNILYLASITQPVIRKKGDERYYSISFLFSLLLVQSQQCEKSLDYSFSACVALSALSEASEAAAAVVFSSEAAAWLSDVVVVLLSSEAAAFDAVYEDLGASALASAALFTPRIAERLKVK